jgi:hypothetical protein
MYSEHNKLIKTFGTTTLIKHFSPYMTFSILMRNTMVLTFNKLENIRNAAGIQLKSVAYDITTELLPA